MTQGDDMCAFQDHTICYSQLITIVPVGKKSSRAIRSSIRPSAHDDFTQG